MRKGIFTKDVEDQAAIAKRLSHAVKRWLCRNHRYGLSERPECKKSARATEDYGFAAETPTERYRAFKGLSREQMDEILGMASRFREQNREEQLKTCPDSGEVQGENGERPPAHAQGQGR